VSVVVSSRTPEGAPNVCPVCHNELKIEPSRPALDGPCPHCGYLLWFTAGRSADRRQQTDGVLETASARLGPPSCEMRAAIESVVKVEQLEQMLELSVRCDSWNQLVTNLTA
jgi:hypothetical protein